MEQLFYMMRQMVEGDEEEDKEVYMNEESEAYSDSEPDETNQDGQASSGRPHGNEQDNPDAAENDGWRRVRHGEFAVDESLSFDSSISGQQIPADGDGKPHDFFNLFMTESFYELFVTETNRYARQAKERLAECEEMVWQDTTVEEMHRFVALLLAMGQTGKMPISLLWERRPPVIELSRFFKRVMPQERFSQLLKFWHLANNDEIPQKGSQNYDRLFKIRRFFDALIQRFKDVYHPGQGVFVDQTIIAAKRQKRDAAVRMSMQERIMRGMKGFFLYEVGSGYICNMLIKTGGEKKVKSLAYTSRVVKELVKQLTGCGRTVYTDKVFSSVALCEDLLAEKTTVCGELSRRRRGNPPDISRRTVDLRAGQVLVRQKGQVVALRTRDPEYSMLLSTVYTAKPVQRRRRRRNEPSSRPEMVENYDEAITGFDESKQNLSFNTEGIGQVKWWKSIAIDLIQLASRQAYVLYCKQHRINLTWYKFTNQLVLELTGLTEEEVDMPSLESDPEDEGEDAGSGSSYEWPDLGAASSEDD